MKTFVLSVCVLTLAIPTPAVAQKPKVLELYPGAKGAGKK